jgi:hypothetical protein
MFLLRLVKRFYLHPSTHMRCRVMGDGKSLHLAELEKDVMQGFFLPASAM